MIRERIARPDVDYVSVKISAVVRQPRRARLRRTRSSASASACARSTATREAAAPRTFVNLDMEEYRDLPLTVAAFMRVLDEPEFAACDAGIVLQAYLPDSHDGVRATVRVGARRVTSAAAAR